MTTSRSTPLSLSSSASSLNEMTHAGTDVIRDYYDRWASSYDEDLDAIGYVAPRRAAEMMLTFGIAPSDPILDAGCGTGLTGAELSRCGFTSVTGIDVSTVSLNKAREKECYARLAQQDLNEALDFAAASFAAAQCIGTLTYIANCGHLMREFCRVVRPGGIVLFTHRTDFYDEGFSNLLDDLIAEGLWTRLSHSDPQPYLPHHQDFGADKTIIYDIYRVL